MIRRHRAMKALEIVLLAGGLSLAAWSGATLLEARYVNTLPLPPAAPATDIETSSAAAAAARRAPVVPPGSVVAKFEAPTVKLSATVLEGSTDDVLSKAAGHLEETALPGAAGNVGIAGHRDTTFRAVRNLKVGDPILLHTRKGTFEYRITKMFIVNPDAVWVLDQTDHPVLTLVTCYPFTYIGHAPKRYIIKADMVGTR
jgi:sortase A